MRLAIVGASTRAAAFSALAAGFEVVAADLFADADLTERCPVTAVADWPAGFVDWLDGLQADAWFYAGGMENHPVLVAQMSERVPLLGTPPAVLQIVRDPIELAARCAAHNIPFPITQRQPPTSSPAGKWLVKQTNSSGGLGIKWLTQSNAIATPKTVFQEYIEDAEPWSALFVVDHDRAQLLGISRQLIGCEWLSARPFAYCGSITASSLPSATAIDSLARIGRMLLEAGSVGLVGVDLLVRHDECWLVEVNPRFPASAEVIERGLTRTAIAVHVSACQGIVPAISPVKVTQAHGKAILYATRDVRVSREFHEWAFEQRMQNGGWLADIPPAETMIPEGSPVLTLLALDVNQVEERLQLGASQVASRL